MRLTRQTSFFSLIHKRKAWLNIHWRPTSWEKLYFRFQHQWFQCLKFHLSYFSFCSWSIKLRCWWHWITIADVFFRNSLELRSACADAPNIFSIWEGVKITDWVSEITGVIGQGRPCSVCSIDLDIWIFFEVFSLFGEKTESAWKCEQ